MGGIVELATVINRMISSDTENRTSDFHTAIGDLMGMTCVLVRDDTTESQIATCYITLNKVITSASSNVLYITLRRQLVDLMVMSLDFYACNRLIVLEIYKLFNSLLCKYGSSVCEDITYNDNFAVFLRLIQKHTTQGDCMIEWIGIIHIMGRCSVQLRREIIISDVLSNILVLTHDCLTDTIRFRDSYKWFAKTVHFIQSFVFNDMFHNEETYLLRCKTIFQANEDGSDTCWIDIIFQVCEILLVNGHESIAVLSLSGFVLQIIDKKIVCVDSLSKRFTALKWIDRIENYWLTALEYCCKHDRRCIGMLINSISSMVFVVPFLTTRPFKIRFLQSLIKLTREDETLTELAYVIRLRIMSQLCVNDVAVCNSFYHEVLIVEICVLCF